MRFYPIYAKRFRILQSFFYAKVSSHVSRTHPEKLPSGSLSVEVASNGWLDSVDVFVTKVEEGSAFRSEWPFVEVGEVRIRLQIAHIDFDLVHSMCSINEKRYALFSEKCNQWVNWSNECRHWNDMIEDSQFYFLWVTVHEILDFELVGLRRLHIFKGKINLSCLRVTSRIVMPKCYWRVTTVLRMEAYAVFGSRTTSPYCQRSDLARVLMPSVAFWTKYMFLVKQLIFLAT